MNKFKVKFRKIHIFDHYIYYKLFTNNLDQEGYSTILLETLLPFGFRHYKGRRFYIHQDNSPIHTSHRCRDIIGNTPEAYWV